ncbi:MAG: type III-B CRISPR-associated protein Cas10/Cmr2 [Thermofilaceae archaeon]|nr:type III-B CRISPR-associated protein Cas10/Cmr2 [Thermofilaceae archaeon]MDW8004133.1 type III-B CRISPR-associated protein Cas10/Cmr2 [Thermofilaceae archaeon]
MSSLFVAKGLALLWDVPHKTFIEKDSEKVTESFREIFLKRVECSSVELDQAREVVGRAYKFSRPLEAWIIEKRLKRYNLEYCYLHNLFNPIYKEKYCDIVFDNERYLEAKKRLSSMLECIDESNIKGEEAVRFKYFTLYAALEPLWLSYGLPISLADLRLPTYTVFDHLYASTVMVNFFLCGDVPKGYLVRIDVPGIQKFISGARKAGDFWAGSWLLSSMTAKIIQKLTERWGPDIILSPSLRLNPFYVLWLAKEFEKRGLAHVTEELTSLYKSVMSILGLGHFIGGDGLSGLEKLEVIQLVPATILFVLPNVGDLNTVEEVRSFLLKLYKDSWKKSIEEVEKSAESYLKDPEKRRVVEKLHEHARKVYEEPPTSPRVYVVDVEELYNELVSHLSGEQNVVRRGFDPSKYRLKELKNKLKDFDAREVASLLIWHVALEDGFARSSLEAPIPAPRPFWLIVDSDLKTAGDFTSLVKVQTRDDWRVCSLCGEEPAVLHLGKVVGRKGGVVVEDFDNEMLNKLVKIVDDSNVGRESLEAIVKELIRPGEALGPYCLLKRLVGVIYVDRLRDALGLASTDDVALRAYDEALAEIQDKSHYASELLETYIKKFGDAMLFVLPKSVLSKRVGSIPESSVPEYRDVNRAAQVSGLDYDSFKRRFEGLCRDAPCEFVADLIEKLSGGSIKSTEVREWIEQTPAERRRLVSSLCNLRTRYAILKGDGDSMGRIAQGLLKALGLQANSYVSSILDPLTSYASVKGQNGSSILVREDSQVLGELRECYQDIADLIRFLEDKLLISPVYSVVFSSSLTLSALKDVGRATRLGAFIIYAGGDDILALSPVERALEIVKETRSVFCGNGSMFHKINNIPILPTIPTGRSYSLRLVELMDVMGDEIGKTIELLDNVAKNAVWRRGEDEVLKKDSVVISDSRSPFMALLPLSTRNGGKIEPLFDRLLANTLQLSVMSTIGLVSKNLPEDLDDTLSHTFDPEKRIELTPVALEKVISYVVRRNVNARRNLTDKVAATVLEKISLDGKSGFEIRLANGASSMSLGEMIIEAVRVMRW